MVDAYFSATKIMWMLDNIPGVRERAEAGDILFGTVDTWLIWNLSGGHAHVTDSTNASRTMLYNINTMAWDEKLLGELGIPRAMLPEVKGSSENCASANILGSDIPICGIAGDQQAALFGQRCFSRGDAKNTYGTGCFLLMNTGEVPITSSGGLIATVAASPGAASTVAASTGEASQGARQERAAQYALEGSVFTGGAVVQWLRDELKLIGSAAESEQCASRVGDSAGVYIVPAFSGLGAPWWDMRARGAMFGITRGANKDHIVRAALESIAYQTKDVLDAMRADTGIGLSELSADGGASANKFLMQFQADILGIDVVCPDTTEATALGAAYLAGLAAGVWKDTGELCVRQRAIRRFSPEMGASRRDELRGGWARAVERSFNWE